MEEESTVTRALLSFAALLFAFLAQAAEVPAEGFAVWTADSMRRVSPMEKPGEIRRQSAIAIMMARNERESCQILLTCGKYKELSNVSAELSGLLQSGWGDSF